MRHFHIHGAQAPHADEGFYPTTDADGAVTRAELATADEEAPFKYGRAATTSVAANFTATAATAAHRDQSSEHTWFCCMLTRGDLQYVASYVGAEQDTCLGVSPIPVTIFSVGLVGAVHGRPNAAAAVDLVNAVHGRPHAADR